MSGTSGGPPKAKDPVLDLLIKTLESVNKDTLGQFTSTRSVQGAPIHGTLKAYAALDIVAQDIAKVVAATAAKHGITPVLLQPGEDMAELMEYRATLARLDAFGDQLDAEAREAEKALEPAIAEGGDHIPLIDPATLATMAAVSRPAAEAAIHLLGLFTRTSTTEQHGNVAIADADLVAAVAKALEATSIEAILPASVALGADQDATAPTRLLARLGGLHDKARTLRSLLTRIEARLAPEPAPAADEARDRLSAQLAALQGSHDDLPEGRGAQGAAAAPPDSGSATPEGDAARAALIARIAASLAKGDDRKKAAAAEAARTLRLRIAKAQIDAALKSVETTWAALPAALPRLLRGDAMQHRLGGTGGILALRLLVAGGSTRTETGAWPFRAPLVEDSGGALASFALFDSRGCLLENRRAEHIAAARRQNPPKEDTGILGRLRALLPGPRRILRLPPPEEGGVTPATTPPPATGGKTAP